MQDTAILRTHKNIYNKQIRHVTLQFGPVKTRRKLLIAKLEKCLANSKTKNMFKTIKKKHAMTTRKGNKYQETNAKTVRMAKSAIPTMQKHLNKKHEQMKKLLR